MVCGSQFGGNSTNCIHSPAKLYSLQGKAVFTHQSARLHSQMATGQTSRELTNTQRNSEENVSWPCLVSSYNKAISMGDAENLFQWVTNNFPLFSVQRSVFDSSEVDRVALGWQQRRRGGTFEVTFFVKTGKIFNTGKDVVGIPQLMCKVQQGERGLCGVGD